MPLELLHQLVAESLPARVEAAPDIDKLRILRAAGLVRADLPDMLDDGAIVGPALVHEITKYGLMLLDHGGEDGCSHEAFASQAQGQSSAA